MKKALLLAVMLCAGLAVWAQKLYFVHIQSDARSPFYVKMGDKVFSSSASGYLILSRLVEGNHTMQIGPSANEGELQFSVPLQQTDRGFLLKKFAEGWALFDLQTMEVIKAVNQSAAFNAGVRVRDDRFTQLLAAAADDTTLFYQPVFTKAPAPKKETAVKTGQDVVKRETEKLPEPVKVDSALTAAVDTDKKEATASLESGAEKVIDSAVAVVAPVISVEDSAPPASQRSDMATTKTEEKATVDSTAVAVVADTTATTVDTTAAVAEAQQAIPDSAEVAIDTEEVYVRSKVVRRSESSTVDGFGLVFWDQTANGTDTIRIFIPNQKFVFAEPDSTEDDKPLVVEKPASNAKQNAATTSGNKTAAPATCNGKATDKDFFRLRKALVAYDSEREMVIAAQSGFRKKCYSVEQIKNLSTLFLTQEGKWLFLEAAYPTVPDKQQFATLQSELYEEPYLARFKSLIGK